MQLHEFGDPPESVAENVAEMRSIMEQRTRGNDAVRLKHDTGRYLILVFPDRSAREAVLRELGLPPDERYVYGPAIKLQIREPLDSSAAHIEAERPCTEADVRHSGAGG